MSWLQIHRSLYVWSLTNWQMSYRYECEHRCSIIFHSSLTRTSRRKQVLVFLQEVFSFLMKYFMILMCLKRSENFVE